MWTRLVRISDPGQWFGKIHEPVTRVQHLVRTNSYVNATVSLVRRYGAVVCMKKRELTQDPDCTLALLHVLDLLTWASYPGQIFPVWTQVNISDDNLMMWKTWTTDPGTICEHGLNKSEGVSACWHGWSPGRQASGLHTIDNYHNSRTTWLVIGGWQFIYTL